MATVASVKRSAQGNNFVDPYTEEEVDARYRLMLKPGEVREQPPVSVLVLISVRENKEDSRLLLPCLWNRSNLPQQTAFLHRGIGLPLDASEITAGTNRRAIALAIF